MKTYLNNYNKDSKVRYKAYHITTKDLLPKILKSGLKPFNKLDKLVYLYENDNIVDLDIPVGYYKVRDAIAYNQLFLGEGDEAIEIEVDITDYVESGKVFIEICVEPTEKYHRVIKGSIPVDKIIGYDTFTVIDPFKTYRPSNNDIQREYRKRRHSRKNFVRELVPFNPTSK